MAAEGNSQGRREGQGTRARGLLQDREPSSMHGPKKAGPLGPVGTGAELLELSVWEGVGWDLKRSKELQIKK